MAEIRYTGMPQQWTPGVGAGLEKKWSNFLAAELPMDAINALPLGKGKRGGKRQQLIAALMKLLQEEEEDQLAASGGVPAPGFGPQGPSLLDRTLADSPTFDMTKFGE